MELNVSIQGRMFAANTAHFVDACNPVTPYAEKDEQTHCFHLPAAKAAPYTAGSFVASVSAGASINCPVISSMCVHSNGTHTECVGHALPGSITLLDVFRGSSGPCPALMPALLLTVQPARLGDTDEQYTPGQPDDRVVVGSLLDTAAAAVDAAWSGASGDAGPGVCAPFLRHGALLIRTLPNASDKKKQGWSGTNPPYLTPSAMKWALDRGAQHILCDLPSADREDDQGLLLAHRAWWELPPRGTEIPAGQPLCTRTITELCYIPGPPDASSPASGYETARSAVAAGTETAPGPAASVQGQTEVPDGPYLLNLAVGPVALDAAPSRPMLHPVRSVK